MPLFRPTGGAWRPPYTGREVVVSPWRGQMRVQRWPRQRGLPKKRRDRVRLEIFALLQKAIKHLSARETLSIQNALRRHNQTHAGQRGSAAIRHRDWQHMRMSGRFFAITLPGGLIAYPPAIKRDASKMLDHTTDTPNTLATRGPLEWQGTPPGEPGTFFTASEAGQSPAWKPIT